MWTSGCVVYDPKSSYSYLSEALQTSYNESCMISYKGILQTAELCETCEISSEGIVKISQDMFQLQLEKCLVLLHFSGCCCEEEDHLFVSQPPRFSK